MQNMPIDERTLLRRIDELEKRIKSLETSPRAGHTSISGGHLTVRDTETGAVIASLASADGTDQDGNDIPAGLSASTGSVDGTILQPGSVDATKVDFVARDISGVTTTTSTTAPAAPVVGDLWIDTGNGNLLKRWSGTAWTPLPVGANAIQAGSITASQIAANTITAGQIAAGAITASEIAAGAIDGELITGATIVADSAGGGVFVYAGTPAAGNLAVALAPAEGADAYGNTVTQGVTVSGYMAGETSTGISLQPRDVGSSTFDPAVMFARTFTDGLGELIIASPMDTSKGSDTSMITMRGSDAVNGGESSLSLDAGKLLFGGGQDYESWTPTVSGNGSATVSTRDGWYVQFGDLILFNAYIQFSAAGVSTDTSNIMLTLPFTPFRGSANRRQVYTGYLSATGTGGTNGPLACVTTAGGSTGIDQIVMDTGTSLQGRHLAAASIITVQGMFRRA